MNVCDKIYKPGRHKTPGTLPREPQLPRSLRNMYLRTLLALASLAGGVTSQTTRNNTGIYGDLTVRPGRYIVEFAKVGQLFLTLSISFHDRSQLIRDLTLTVQGYKSYGCQPAVREAV